MDINNTTAVILAGGSGERMGGDMPKQFLSLNEKPLIMYTLERFSAIPEILDIVVVCRAAQIEYLREMIKIHGIEKIKCVVPGGKTRQESSFIGVKSCSGDEGIILIHDAVRPFVSSELIKNVIEKAKVSGAVIPVTEVCDAIVREEKDDVADFLNRDAIKRVQTPQGFSSRVIMNAHEQALEEGVLDLTDDGSLVLKSGCILKTVRGDKYNIKVTDQKDLIFAETLIKTGLVEE
ncbi:MAG: 2-C-methyl-D-erythritol 4-phosphate cytidylyltransferase [Candidatus Omnitrophica bacterium]|nr:2-C-methyl-D-erythritol 4-phosphate cytidylyltransferase [Candidatus Omnitrophota bacterium]